MSKPEAHTNSLRDIEWPQHLHGPGPQLVEELYVPALRLAAHYDRSCAYFSSTVLSAASAGFAGLIESIISGEKHIQKPAVRLLVNEQLDPNDLEALLATGDHAPMISSLLKQFKTPKDALEKARLKTLAWLVANGWLEVRVGLMRRTGGIAHAKYGIVRDARGDDIVFFGSSNETREGLISNYEELRIFVSWKEKGDTAHYQGRFDELWENRDESVLVIPLPQAVEEKLIRFAPSEPPVVEPSSKSGDLQAAAQWRFLAAAPYLPGGERACDATAMVDLWPHQGRVVEDTSGAFPSGRLFCDEVGLGKTIEAIATLRRLLAGRGVKRALFLVPAGLMEQWQGELREKGGVIVPRWDGNLIIYPDGHSTKADASTALAKHDVLILSREWARLQENKSTVLGAPPWDLVLLDEAHAARRRAPKEGEFNSGNFLLDLLRDLQLQRRARGIILLSATPMQTNPWEPWDLLSVLGVGGNWIADFSDIRGFYDCVASLPLGDLSTDSVKTVAALVSSDPEFPAAPLGGGDVEDDLAFAMGDERLEYAAWLRRGAPLGRRMHRNTRETLKAYHRMGLLPNYTPSTRDVQDVVFDYEHPDERQCYETVKHYIDERFEQFEGEKSGKGFVMTVYRRRAASCPYSLRRSLERRLDGCERVISKQWTGIWDEGELELDSRDLGDVEIDRVDPALPATPQAAEAEKEDLVALLGKLNGLGNWDSKYIQFARVLSDITADGRPVLVFTEYYDTLTYLREQLLPVYGATLGCYSGQGGEIMVDGKWTGRSKADISEMLNDGKLRVLVCTDAASEGLNLQAASALINYDLPWNPSKVEQRIGRIDRIGQQQTVLPIRNLFLKDSVDMRVYQALRLRCGMFTQFVGRMQPILALARDALRNDQADSFLGELEGTLRRIDEDATITNAFFDDEPSAGITDPPAATRSDIETALSALGQAGLAVSAKAMKGKKSWRLSGIAQKSVNVSADRATLERDTSLMPISLGSRLVEQIASKVVKSSSRLPLVVAEFSQGAYRAIEARWVKGDRFEAVTSFAQLRKLLADWDESAPSIAAVHAAEEHARKAARSRVKAMAKLSDEREQAGLKNQVEAARARLRRELGRTLRCFGGGDLRAIFDGQMNRESRPDGRYRKAHQLLGSVPNWTTDEIAAINAFVSGLNSTQRQVRMTGTEVDAALSDPRWKALDVSPR